MYEYRFIHTHILCVQAWYKDVVLGSVYYCIHDFVIYVDLNSNDALQKQFVFC